jgi:AcrR family transcriptional regulator
VPADSDHLSIATHPGASTIDRALAVVGAILDAGGEGSLRLADVSSRSGVSVGSLYHHFGSREGMIDAARERQLLESLPDDAFEEDELLLATSTAELVERVGNQIRETPVRELSRRRRLETIAVAARRPGQLAGVVAIQASHLDVGENMARHLIARGWLRDDVEPRALALLLDILAVSAPLREVDVHPVDSDAWDKLLRLCIEGLLVSHEASYCPA